MSDTGDITRSNTHHTALLLLQIAGQVGPGQIADDCFQLLKDLLFARVIPMTYDREYPGVAELADRSRYPAGPEGDLQFQVSVATSHRLNYLIERLIERADDELAGRQKAKLN